MNTAAASALQEPQETSQKRKRDPDDNGGGQSMRSDRIPQPPPPQSGNGAPINYLSKATPPKLGLIQGDSETFADVLALIVDYEGVLSRHESLAANLGAKLTAPRLLRAMENMFDGSINVTPLSPPYSADPRPASAAAGSGSGSGSGSAGAWGAPSWLEVLAFAKSNPSEFVLTTTPDKRRVCQFLWKNLQVEIGEDDWRLIKTGAVDRFHLVPHHPVEEDEAAELATVEIVEQRLQILIKRADEVARKARQLNYHLSGRKASIANARRSSPSATQGPSSSGITALNQPPVRAPTPTAPGYDLYADLLQQFLSTPPAAHAASISRPPSTASASVLPPPSTPSEMHRGLQTPGGSVTQIQPPATTAPLHVPSGSGSSRRSPAAHAVESPALLAHAEDPTAAHKPLIQARLDKLSRGETIFPPCDRCRRLKAVCTKHLTACQGCTRKHAKCSWKTVTDEELIQLRGELSGPPSGSSSTFGAAAGPSAGLHSGTGPSSGDDEGGGDDQPVSHPNFTGGGSGSGPLPTAETEANEGARVPRDFSTRRPETLPGLRLPALGAPSASPTLSTHSTPGPDLGSHGGTIRPESGYGRLGRTREQEESMMDIDSVVDLPDAYEKGKKPDQGPRFQPIPGPHTRDYREQQHSSHHDQTLLSHMASAATAAAEARAVASRGSSTGWE